MSESNPHVPPELESRPYVLHPTHAVLGIDAHRERGANIGRRADNLTITFMTLNRAALSVRLLRSIDEWLGAFDGEVLVIDNGSDPAELATVRAACEAMRVRSRIVELGRNFGVAGGRNRTIPHLRTDWAMFLDNDMYFVGDPLEVIQRELATLGCHFLNLPLLDRDGQTLFARGGHLYVGVDSGTIWVAGGSVSRQERYDGAVVPGFLSTFLFGGACVLNRHTFLQVGGYDDGMFIGFEDIDFSIRLFQAGLKVGNTGVAALVHDHPAPEKTDDRAYEQQRYSREILKKSAAYFEAKHGFVIWTPGVEEWLTDRQRALGLMEEAPLHTPPAPAQAIPGVIVSQRPRVALLVDIEGWAFSNIAGQIVRYLGDRFDFEVIPTTVLENAVHTFMAARHCDVIHVFWREFLRVLESPYPRAYVEWMGLRFDEFVARELKSKAISTAIYDHLYLAPEEREARRSVFRDFVDGYYVCSQRLAAIYRTMEGYPPPLMVLEDGVDLTRFVPKNPPRFDRLERREIVVGWAGNSRWAAHLEDFKGVRSILLPAIDELVSEGVPVRAFLADAAERRLPHDEMVDFYSRIDLYVSPSKVEGTPNPVLEAMACGVPVITTDVGVVREALGPRQQEFILAERSVAAMKAAIRRVAGDAELMRTLSVENLASIRAWDWSVKTRGFGDYFDLLLRRKGLRS